MASGHDATISGHEHLSEGIPASVTVGPFVNAKHSSAMTYPGHPPNEEGNYPAISTVLPLTQEILQCLNVDSRLPLKAWLTDNEDKLICTLSLSNASSKSSSIYSRTLASRSSLLLSSIDELVPGPEFMSDITPTSHSEPDVEAERCSHLEPPDEHVRAASVVRGEANETSNVQVRQYDMESATRRERLLSTLQRADALLSRLRRFAAGTSLDYSIDDIVSEFNTLCIDNGTPVYTQTPLGETSHRAARLPTTVDQTRATASSPGRSHVNTNKRLVRDHGGRRQDQPQTASQAPLKDNPTRFMYCIYHFGPDPLGRFCRTLHEYPSHLQ